MIAHVGHNQPSSTTSSQVSTGMGGRVRSSTPGARNLSRSNQPPSSTQPGHPSVGSKKVQSVPVKNVDALQLRRSKGG